MTEYLDRRTPNRVRAQLEAARTAGAWMPWAGAALALLLWGGIAAWLVATIGPVQLLAQPPLMLAGGFAVMISTGLALICAGVMAREGARSAEANQIVLTSARLLLEPAEATHGEVTNLAEAISRETQTLNKALGETRSRLDGLKHDIESSVTAALKAAEIVRADSEVLVHKMSSERQSLTQLAESLRNQSESLAKSIPRHAQMMSEAARAAQDQVRQADATLDQRLKDLQETAGHLASRIDQLDTMGAESRKRAQNLGGALARLDEQLVQSTRMVEAATKAGELAQAAAKSTAESLRDTVSDALGSAMKATETINAKSAQAAEDARYGHDRAQGCRPAGRSHDARRHDRCPPARG
jgi:chromosome segregation ATPase